VKPDGVFGVCTFLCLSVSSKETEAFQAAEDKEEKEKVQKSNGYLFNPDEESDADSKTPTNESGMCIRAFASTEWIQCACTY